MKNQTSKWKNICLIIVIIHLVMLFVSSSIDIYFSIGLVLPFVMSLNTLSLILDLFGIYVLFQRIKTALLFYTLCIISFALVTASIEIIYEMRNFVFGQQRTIFLPMADTVDSVEFALYFLAKYARIFTALAGLLAGGTVYIYRQAVVKQAIGDFAKSIGPVREIEIEDAEDYTKF